MLSRLDTIIKNTLRHTESSDTRQDIRRDETKHVKDKNHKERNKKHKIEQWDDETIVSIPALLAFLKSLIKIQSHNSQDITGITPNQPKNIENGEHDLSPPSARAAKAYENTARSSQKQLSNELDSLQTDNAQINDLHLSTEEQRHIHALIVDLNTLYNKGYEDLKIIKSGSFLDSIISSVEQIKSNI